MATNFFFLIYQIAKHAESLGKQQELQNTDGKTSEILGQAEIALTAASSLSIRQFPNSMAFQNVFYACALCCVQLNLVHFFFHNFFMI